MNQSKLSTNKGTVSVRNITLLSYNFILTVGTNVMCVLVWILYSVHGFRSAWYKMESGIPKWARTLLISLIAAVCAAGIVAGKEIQVQRGGKGEVRNTAPSSFETDLIPLESKIFNNCTPFLSLLGGRKPILPAEHNFSLFLYRDL